MTQIILEYNPTWEDVREVIDRVHNWVVSETDLGTVNPCEEQHALLTIHSLAQAKAFAALAHYNRMRGE